VIHVVIPAAGEGSRFAAAGYKEPKPLIPVLGKPMIQRVIDNIRPGGLALSRVTVLSQVPLPFIEADVKVIGPTRGAVETILQADIRDGERLLVANCDQLVSTDWAVHGSADGAIATFRSSKPHHSYVHTRDGIIDSIVEKRVISELAVAGVYSFSDGGWFRAAAAKVLADDRRVLNEFYVSTVISEMITQGAKLRTFDADVAILGTPEELQLFEAAARVARSL
jgi:dTDP-glucose pyrophosphorylase